jgi:hypothetical protein
MRRAALYIAVAVLTSALGLLASFLTTGNRSQGISTKPATYQLTSPEIWEREVDARWLYLNEDVQWTGRDDTRYYNESKNARVLVFFPSGDFASVSCPMLRFEATSELTVIPDGRCEIYKGSWKQNSDGTITTASHLHKLFAPFPAGEKLAPATIENLSVRKTDGDRFASLDLKGKVFLPSQQVKGLNGTLLLADIVD